MAKLCDGRTVIVTGAGGGLGRAYALALAEHGANVMVVDINAVTAAQTVDDIKAVGGKAEYNLGNITSYEGAGDIFKATLDTFGDVHAIVNNAGTTAIGCSQA